MLAGFLSVCLLGSAVHFGLTLNFRPLRWAKTSAQKIHKQPPNLNSADAQALDKVPGIGPKTAQNIIEYRRTHGPFFSVEGLRKVKGLSKKNFEKIRAYYQEGYGQ